VTQELDQLAVRQEAISLTFLIQMRPFYLLPVCHWL